MIGQRLVDREAFVPPMPLEGPLPTEARVVSEYNVLDAAAGKNPWTDRLAERPNDAGPPWDEGPHVPVVTTCDVCAAAKLAEAGIMPTTLTPEQLHSTCRRPGSCSCGCPRSRSVPCANCGRILPDEEMHRTRDGYAECADRDACGAAMLERASAPANLPKATSTTPRAPRPPSEPRPARSVTPKAPKTVSVRPCTCRCGEMTGGGMYRPGHDAKHLSRLTANLRAGSAALEEALAELPTEALKAKLVKRLEA